jgi:hypothetical protein
MKGHSKFLLFALLISLFCSSFVSADIEITSCNGFVIDSSDTYYLTGNLNYTTGTDCIYVAINDVIIDCNGYSIDFEDGSAVDTYSAISFLPTCYNVEIKNCIIKGRWLYGIFDNTGDSDNLYIHDNEIYNMSYGIFSISPYGIIENNKINTTSQYLADTFTIQLQANGWNITGNILSIDTGEGIRLNGGATNNNIYNNYINGSTSIGEWDDDAVNYFNTTEYVATNIIGGANIGGNWYSDYNGTDGDLDGFGDTPYLIYNTQLAHYTPAMNDSLPLAFPSLNTAPVISGIAIAPATAYTDSILNCSATYTDADLDAGSVTLKFNNGTFSYTNTLTGVADGELVSLALVYDLTKGETWNCSINASDGTDESALVSTTRDVSNSVPTATNNAISPATAYPNSTIICTGTASDLDSEDVLGYYYRFSNSTDELQAYSTTDNFTCDSDSCPESETISCDFKANDGTNDSNVITNSTIIIAIPLPVIPTPENPFNIQCPEGNDICFLLQGTGAGTGIFINYLSLSIPILLVAIAVAGGIIVIMGAISRLKDKVV